MKHLLYISLFFFAFTCCTDNSIKSKSDKSSITKTENTTTQAPLPETFKYYKLDSLKNKPIYLLQHYNGAMYLLINADTILLCDGDAKRFRESKLTDTIVNKKPTIIAEIYYYFSRSDGNSAQFDSHTDIYLVDKIKGKVLFSFSPQNGHLENYHELDSAGKVTVEKSTDDSYSYNYSIEENKIIISSSKGKQLPDLKTGVYVFKDSTYIKVK